ncbi:Aspartate/glutamate/uridylate kinase, partial [Penicillium malachiteum]
CITRAARTPHQPHGPSPILPAFPVEYVSVRLISLAGPAAASFQITLPPQRGHFVSQFSTAHRSRAQTNRGVTQLLTRGLIDSKHQIQHYLKRLHPSQGDALTVIALGPNTLSLTGPTIRAQLEQFADSLVFLRHVGLFPVIVHASQPIKCVESSFHPDAGISIDSLISQLETRDFAAYFDDDLASSSPEQTIHNLALRLGLRAPLPGHAHRDETVSGLALFSFFRIVETVLPSNSRIVFARITAPFGALWQIQIRVCHGGFRDRGGFLRADRKRGYIYGTG